MKLAKYIAAVAALGMATAPALAAPANPAASLSLSKSARAGAPVSGSNKMAAGSGWIIGAVAAAAVIAGIIIIADDDDNGDSN